MKTLILILIMTSAWPAAAQNPSAPQERGEGRRGGPGGFGGPIELKEDDKPAFPVPPTGWDVKREAIPHGKVEMIDYSSVTSNRASLASGRLTDRSSALNPGHGRPFSFTPVTLTRPSSAIET